MPGKEPKITALRPVVLKGNRRVTLELTVDNLPAAGPANIMFMPDISDPPPAGPPRPISNTPGSYPHIELSILNSRRQQVASLLIVEHKERQTALTLHLPAPDTAEQYTARAEMTYNDDLIDVVEVPFTLNQAAS